MLAGRDDHPAPLAIDYAERMRTAGNGRIRVKIYSGAHHGWESIGPVFDIKDAENWSCCTNFIEDDGSHYVVAAGRAMPEPEYQAWARRHCITRGARAGGGTAELKARATADLLGVSRQPRLRRGKTATGLGDFRQRMCLGVSCRCGAPKIGRVNRRILLGAAMALVPSVPSPGFSFLCRSAALDGIADRRGARGCAHQGDPCRRRARARSRMVRQQRPRQGRCRRRREGAERTSSPPMPARSQTGRVNANRVDRTSTSSSAGSSRTDLLKAAGRRPTSQPGSPRCRPRATTRRCRRCWPTCGPSARRKPTRRCPVATG